MENGFKYSIVEALILASPEPLPARKIADTVDDMTPSMIGQTVAELNNRYMIAGNSFRIREIAGGYQFYIVPEFTGYVEEMFMRQRKIRMTRAALETLAIIAYRQPVSKTDIEQIRGVASDGVLHNLLEKNMITIKGRAKTVGKPLLYGTTDEFLTFFGLNSLEDLPKMSEIEQLVSSKEAQSQTELHLGESLDSDNGDLALNVDDLTEKTAAPEGATCHDVELSGEDDFDDIDDDLDDKELQRETASIDIDNDDGSSGSIVDLDTT